MNRRDVLKSTFGAALVACIPAKAAATDLPVTQWMGVPCAQLPDITVPNLSQDNLYLAYKAITNRDYVVGWAFMNKWDLVRMEQYWDIDRETHGELHYLGIRGYLWGMGLTSSIMIDRGNIFILSSEYEPNEKPYRALLQKLVIEHPYQFVSPVKDGYVYRREYNAFGKCRITRYGKGTREMSFDGGVTWS